MECAHHVARAIVNRAEDESVHLIGFPGCFPNEYSLKIMQALGTHPNVGGVLLVSLGCEGFNREALTKRIKDSGRPVETLVIQQTGGTKRSIDAGLATIKSIKKRIIDVEKVDMDLNELVVGTICGGSDGTSSFKSISYCIHRTMFLFVANRQKRESLSVLKKKNWCY